MKMAGNKNKQKFLTVSAVFSLFILLAALNLISPTHSRKTVLIGKIPAVLGTTSAACDTTLNNSSVCPPLPVNIPGKAGDSYIDPVFGTVVTRITDLQNAPYGATPNTYMSDSIFNADGSMFFVNVNRDPAHIFLTPTASTQLKDLGYPATDLSLDGAVWDPKDPKVFYAVANAPYWGVWKLQIVSTAPLKVTRSLLLTFPSMPYGPSISPKLQISNDARYFAIMANSTPDSNDDNDYVSVGDVLTQKSQTLLMADAFSGYRADDIQMDNSGKYILIRSSTRFETDLADNVWFVWNWQNNKTDQLTVNEPDTFSKNFALGNAEVFNYVGGTLLNRQLTDLHNPTNVFDYPTRNNLVDLYSNYYFSGETTSGTDSSGVFLQTASVDPLKASIILHVEGPNQNLFKVPNYISNNQFKDDVSIPEEVRFRGISLKRVNFMPNDINQWYYDSNKDTLYFTAPITIDAMTDDYVQVFDWRPMSEEISMFLDGQTISFRRLAHTYNGYDGTPNTIPKAFIDPTQNYILFNSNWNGTLKNVDGTTRTDMFLIKIPKLPNQTLDQQADQSQ